MPIRIILRHQRRSKETFLWGFLGINIDFGGISVHFRKGFILGD